ncbi:MAG: glycosyltransferase [Sedimentisphaerales bacterium]|nr:glycosyltransferase [Sedimentisphaerales bacterium]
MLRRKRLGRNPKTPVLWTLDNIIITHNNLTISGWAFSQTGTITQISVWIDDILLGNVEYGLPRPDVAAHFSDPQKEYTGFTGVFDIANISTGEHILTLEPHDDAMNFGRFSQRISIKPTDITIQIDTPSQKQVVFKPTLLIEGWVISAQGEITAVEAVLDNQTTVEIEYGLPRPDVATHLGDSTRVSVGFAAELNIENIQLGKHDLTICAQDNLGQAKQSDQSFFIQDHPIRMGIDAPKTRETLDSHTLSISGWAFSRLGPIVNVEVFLQATSLGTLEHGRIRPDIARIYNHPRALESAFNGTVLLPLQDSPDYSLTVLAVDKTGNKQYLPIDVRLKVDEVQPEAVPTPLVRPVVTPDDFLCYIDTPVTNAYVYPSFRLSGWAFSLSSRIVSIAVQLGDKTFEVPYGLSRPDVARHLNRSDAEQVGFDDVVDFRNIPHGPTQFSVIAIDEYGHQFSKDVPVFGLMTDPSSVQIDDMWIRDSTLYVKGWLNWAESVPPYTVNFFVNGEKAASCFADIDLPDLSAQFPSSISHLIKGYRIRRQLTPGVLTADKVELTIQVIDQRFTGTQRIIHVTPDTLVSDEQDNSLCARLEKLITKCRAIVDHEVSVLDWNTGLDLRKVLPEVTVFSPLPSKSPRELPYLDGMVDIVVCRPGEASKEARRVAGYAVAAVAGANDIRIEYKETFRDADVLPGVSIIIPVYNKKEYTEACLKSLKATLPDNFQGEVIVADDVSTDGTDEMVRQFAKEWPVLINLRNKDNRGFILNCNGAAEAATGEYLIFLNNDIIAYPKWLENLIGTFKTHPDAGAVGGKLIFPNGTLQEAGGHLFKDATGYNFGQDDLLPFYPLFSFTRKVDYCSAALLATPRELFLDIGGFDTFFAPAYYEDADYCFKVQARGLKVYYQPRSVLMHYRHASYNAENYKYTNAEKFQSRWHDVLASKPSRPKEFTREVLHRLVSPHKRALFFAWLLPKYDETGGLLRPFTIVQQLLDSGWSVSYYARDTTGGERYIRGLQDMGVAVYAGPRSVEAGDEFFDDPARLIAEGQFDLVIVSLWQTATEILPAIRRYSPHTKVIVDSSDIYFQRMSRDAAVKGYLLDANYGQEMIDEVNVYAAADAVFTVSVEETEMINDLIGRQREQAICVPNTTKAPRFNTPFKERAGILIVGSYYYPPNADQVQFLLTEVVPHMDPKLLKQHPIYIVGTNLPDDIRELASGMKHVKAVGWVPSMEPFLRQMRVSVVPLRLGSGTKLKVITAMLSGLPVVCTSIGAEGLDLVHGEHALIADDPKTLAHYIEQGLTNETLWRKLSVQAQELVVNQLGYEAGIQYLTQAIDKVMNR